MAEFGTEIAQSDARIISNTIAATSFLNLTRLDQIASYIFPDSPNLPTEIIDRHASIWGVTRKPPTLARGTVKFERLPTVAQSTIDVGSELSDGFGMTYIITEKQFVSTNSDIISVSCSVAGSAGNKQKGQIITLSSPIEGLKPNAVVIEISGGEDEESDFDLVQRILNRMQQRPKVGTAVDWQAAIDSVSGISKGFIFPRYTGGGKIGFSFILTATEKAFSLPQTQDQIKNVQDQLDTHRSVNINLIPVSITDRIANIEIRSTKNPITEIQQKSINESLRKLFFERAFPPLAFGGKSGRVEKTAIIGKINEIIGFEYQLLAPENDLVPDNSLEVINFGVINVIQR